MNIVSVILIASTLLLFSCNKESNESATLKIKPEVLGCDNDNVRVRLYETDSDYQTLSNHISEKYSVGDNPVEFEELEEKIYYFQCSKPCNAGGSGITANNFCDPSIEVYYTNGALSSDHPQEIEVQMCY